MNLNCEYVREMYPDVLNHTADAATVTAVRAHIARCDDCRAEATLIEQLHAAPVAVPNGLQERIVTELARRRPHTRFRVRNLAYAATVAAAVIGGSILLNTGKRAEAGSDLEGLGFVTVEDAMVTGTSSLRDLTIEELETLLGEIES